MLCFGYSSYEVIILPDLSTVRSITLDALESFTRQGGKVIVAGSVPHLVDAVPSVRAKSLPATAIPFTKTSLLRSLSEHRDIHAVLNNGSEADSLLYQMRVDGDDRYVFVCNTDRQRPRKVRLDIRGQWHVTLLDAMTGEKSRLESEVLSKSWTRLQHHFEGCGSLLLLLTPRATAESPLERYHQPIWRVSQELELDSVSLSEPNVLLLDMARYRIDEEEVWSGLEEILRTDNIARTRLGLPLRQDNLAQPYRVAKVPPKHMIHLLYEFTTTTTTPISGAQIALEGANITKIELDDQPVASNVTGWWVDESISTVALPQICSGKHSLRLSVPFGELTHIERVYILGEFSVDLRGREAGIIDLDITRLRIGDYTGQGLPFYAGDVHYNFTIRGGRGRTAVQVPRFAAPLLRVELDGKPAGPHGLGKIAFQPHVLDLGQLVDGKEYKLRITAVGNRNHAFGAVHLPDGLTKWYGPDAWRTNGDKWAYEYTIRWMGLLTAPRLLTGDSQYASETWDAGSVDQDLWFH